MSDVTVKTETIGNWAVSADICIRNGISYYFVRLYHYESLYLQCVYPLECKSKALACFRRYVKKAKEEQ